ncbi:MAG: response regulator [Clostridiales bacterium]|nr:response regulator [Clostridiales bacterium]
MIQVLIVEDESLVRLGIRTVIEHSGEEYEIVAETDNGLQAVDLILQKQPDIVLLDITIPGLDGLQVLERVRKQGYTKHIIILTCHQDFDYAQQALRLGADDYVLKNEVDGLNIMDFLRRAKVQQGENQANQARGKQERRENFLFNLFMTGLADKQDFFDGCKKYNIPLKDDCLYYLLVHIKRYRDMLKRYEREEQDTLFTAMNSLISESMSKECVYEIMRLSPDNYIIPLSIPNHRGTAETMDILRICATRIQKSVSTFLDMDALVGISLRVHDVCHLPESLQQMIHLLNRNFFFPDETILWESSKLDKSAFTEAMKLMKQEHEKVLKGNEKADILQLMKIVKDKIRDTNVVPDKSTFLYLLKDYVKTLMTSRGEAEVTVPADMTLDQMIGYIGELENISGGADVPQNYLAAQAVEYINNHFAEDLTLDDVARVVGVSGGYLSRIFAKFVGQPVSNYIMLQRVNHAKYLMLNTNLKHYEIAEKCGLNSAAYYTSVFKKYTGITPNQFRNQRGES